MLRSSIELWVCIITICFYLPINGCYTALTNITLSTWLVHTSCQPCTHDACCKQLQEPLHRLTTAHPHQTTTPTNDSPRPSYVRHTTRQHTTKERLADHSEHFPSSNAHGNTPPHLTSRHNMQPCCTAPHPAPPSPQPLYPQSVA